MRSVRGAAVVSLSLLAVAVAVIGYLHLTTGVSPVSGMISDYVFKDPAQIRYGLVTVIVIGCGGAALLLRYARPRFQEKLAAAAHWA